MTIQFKWHKEDLEHRLQTCEIDGIYPLVLKYFPKGTKVLESGCGDGRWVKFLSDKGWDSIGLEISPATIQMVREVWPTLQIVEGDAAFSPFEDNYFDGVISLGVVEHWVEGPVSPLKDIFRVLKGGGIGIITVPCMNEIRKIKRKIWWDEIIGFPRTLMKLLIRNEKIKINRFEKKYKYSVYPAYGSFFEYRMSAEEFIKEINQVGFEVLEHFPIGLMDGLYHDLNPLKLFVKFHNWKFYPSFIAKKLNVILSRYKFFHPHMHGVIVRKPF